MPAAEAVVIATYSRRMRLRLPDGEEHEARIKGKRLRPVCGDRVSAEPIAGENDWLITAIVPRRNELTRPDSQGRTEVLAANLDRLVVVAAPKPAADWFVVDRYLCAAELMGVSAAVLFNKIDLDSADPATATELGNYAAIGYPVVECSARTGAGLDDLLRLIDAQCAIVVGQSGVGKSSIINALSDNSRQRIASVSQRTGEGRHTTVNSVMLPLPGGGTVIDSPGVRDYAPALPSPASAAAGFREFPAAAAGCRFANCRHLREPGCRVKQQVEDGRILPRRYASYKRIVNLAEQLAEGRY